MSAHSTSARPDLAPLGTLLLQALPGVNVLSATVYDVAGAPVWAQGTNPAIDDPLLIDALDAFALEPMRACYQRREADGRTVMVFPLRCPRGLRRGAAMLVAETRTLDGDGNEKSLEPALQVVLRRLSVALGDGTNLAADATVVQPLADLLDGPRPAEADYLTLYVQQLLKLRTSGRTRRYEVLLRSNALGRSRDSAPVDLLQAADDPQSGGRLDRFVVGQLITWLAQHRHALEEQPASFSVNLSAGALHDPGFPGFVSSALHEARINPRILAFEIRESLCRELPADVERFLSACDMMSCQAVIDDFTLHSDVLPLLRHRSVRMLKLDAELTGKAIRDKLAQALVVATVQASKVLGLHCVAKRIDSAISRQWLAASGVDFAQGFLLEGPLPLKDLTPPQAIHQL